MFIKFSILLKILLFLIYKITYNDYDPVKLVNNLNIYYYNISSWLNISEIINYISSGENIFINILRDSVVIP